MTPGGSSPHQPWFHIGTLEVTTSWLVVLIGGVCLIANAITANWLFVHLALLPSNLLEGRVWTLVTWPFAFPVAGILWSVITLALFWYFGSDLERSRLGKSRFLGMLTVWTVVLTVLHLLFTFAFGLDYPIYGLSLLELMVVLLWIAEWPDRRFIFNIPAWLFGVIIVGIQIIQYLGLRNWVLLLDFVVGTAVCAVVARSYGMLTEYSWIPRFGGGQRAAKPAKPRRSGRSGRSGRGAGPAVVQGPWSQQSQPQSSAGSRDEQRMDELLEKIHEQGADSLTAKERKELMQLRERRRRSN